MANKLVLNIIKKIFVLSLFVVGIMAFVFKEPKSIILGYIFGTTISILGFKLLHNTIEKALTMSPGKANAYSMGHYMLRYIIYGVVLTVAILADYLNLLSTFLGLMMVKVVILFCAVFNKEFQE